MPLSSEEQDKINYLTYVESMLSKKNKDTMLLLMEMGYLDYKKNEMLLTKNDGNLEGVLNDYAQML